MSQNPHLVDLRFEGGNHLTGGESDDFFESISKGNLSFELWPDATIDRIRDYAPVLLAVDGLNTEPLHATEEYSAALRRGMLTALPGQPSEISGRDEILVLAGEVSEHGQGRDYLDKSQFNLRLRRLASLATFAAAARYTTGVVVGTKDMVHFARKESTQGSPKSPEERKEQFEEAKILKTRRAFLMNIATIVGGIASGAPALLNLGLADTGSHKANSLARQVSDLDRKMDIFELGQAINPSIKWVDGRTALLIEKTRDSFNQLHLPTSEQASVLMGSSHNARANEFIESQSSRLEAIRELFIVYLNDLINRASEDETFDLDLYIFSTLDELTSSTIYSVSDIDPESFKQDQAAETTASIKSVAYIFHPEILNAVRNLAPHQAKLLEEVWQRHYADG